MHIRRSDSCHDGARTGRGARRRRSTRAPRAAATRYGFRSLLVATDSDGALDELSAAARARWPAGAPVLARNDSQRFDAIRMAMKRIERAWGEGGTIEAWASSGFMTDVAATDCDGLVGKFTSNMDRVVYALMAGRAHATARSCRSTRPFSSAGSAPPSTARKSNATTGLRAVPLHGRHVTSRRFCHVRVRDDRQEWGMRTGQGPTAKARNWPATTSSSSTLISYACIGMIILQLTLINLAEDNETRNSLGVWCASGNALVLVLMLGSLMVYVHKVIAPEELRKEFDDPCGRQDPYHDRQKARESMVLRLSGHAARRTMNRARRSERARRRATRST